MRPFPRLTGLAAAATLAGRTMPPSGHTVMMETQMEACRKRPDSDQRRRCPREADHSYDRYEADAEAARRP